jgi:hypothetical protein
VNIQWTSHGCPMEFERYRMEFLLMTSNGSSMDMILNSY